MDVAKRLTELLSAKEPRARFAAAFVAGELGLKDAALVAGLSALAKSAGDDEAAVAIEALGKLKVGKALGVLLDGLSRSREVQAASMGALSALGEEALPALREKLEQATPEARALLSQLLPKVGSRQSFELTLDGLKGQPWDAINRVALAVRQELREASDAERRVMKTQVEKVLAKKRTAEDELQLRGLLKILGYTELPEAADELLGYLAPKQPPTVRVEAATALRFAMSRAPSKKGLGKLIEALGDADALVSRAARDSLTVLKIGPQFAEELAELCTAKDADIALWAIGHVGSFTGQDKLVAKTLSPLARSGERARAEAAAKALAALPNGPALLVDALAEATDETGAQVLAEALAPLHDKLTKKDAKKLLEAAKDTLGEQLAVAKRQLEPVRAVDAEAWAELLREKSKALAKKDPARAEAVGQLLGRSTVATAEDRIGLAVSQLLHSSYDPHPKARQRDPALAELERLHAEGVSIQGALAKDKKLSDEARYYVGVHFAEKPTFELKNVGAEILEGVADGKGKFAKAAKNKLKLLELV